MKIAYLFHKDAASPAVQSNRPASILANLENQGVAVERFFPLQADFSRSLFLQKIAWRLMGKYYRGDRDEAYLRQFAASFRRAAQGRPFDFIFSPGSEVITYLESDRPITFCADATFANLLDYYWDFTDLPRKYLEKGHIQEKEALARAALAIYPSEWAAQSAIRDYGIAPDRVAVIPFGANFGSWNTKEIIWPVIEQRTLENPRLLFIGKHWQRKGGDIVVETARILRKRGIPVQVDVVGCQIPSQYRGDDFLVEHGSVDAGNPDQASKLTQLLLAADVYFAPSRAEAYGMAYCEACAFGLPSIATATGGITTIVINGVNGWCLPLTAGAEDYADTIAGLLGDRSNYQCIARNAFDRFSTVLNWETFCRDYLQRVKKLVK